MIIWGPLRDREGRGTGRKGKGKEEMGSESRGTEEGEGRKGEEEEGDGIVVLGPDVPVLRQC